ncbi:unnamed protein product, partial [Nesidiocoris tenuis]
PSLDLEKMLPRTLSADSTKNSETTRIVAYTPVPTERNRETPTSSPTRGGWGRELVVPPHYKGQNIRYVVSDRYRIRAERVTPFARREKKHVVLHSVRRE